MTCIAPPQHEKVVYIAHYAIKVAIYTKLPKGNGMCHNKHTVRFVTSVKLFPMQHGLVRISHYDIYTLVSYISHSQRRPFQSFYTWKKTSPIQQKGSLWESDMNMLTYLIRTSVHVTNTVLNASSRSLNFVDN